MAWVKTVFRTERSRFHGSNQKYQKPKVSIRGKSHHFILPITKPEVIHTDLAPNYDEVPRPGKKPIIRAGSRNLRKMRLQCYFANKVPGSSRLYGHKGVDRVILDKLVKTANELDAIVGVGYGPLEQGNWVITDIRVTTEQRRFVNNHVTVAFVEIELTERVRYDDAPNQKPKSAVKKPPTGDSGGGGKSGGKAPVRYTVKKGDTLSKIASRVCGSVDHWPRIAEDNNIKNPHLIYPGQRLTIKC